MSGAATKDNIKPTLDATPATVAVGGNASDLVTPDDAHIASDGHVYDEISEYIDHGSQNNVDSEDLGDEECDVPVVASAPEEENNEDPEQTNANADADDSKKQDPPGFHAIVRHGGSLLSGRGEKWLEEINLKSEEVEVSKRRIRENKQKLINQENKMKVYEKRCLKKKTQQNGKMNAAKNNNKIPMYINYSAKIKDEKKKLKALEEELDGLAKKYYEPLCDLAKELQQFCDETLTNRHSVPVFVFYNEKRSAILVFRPSLDGASTESEEESGQPYLLLCLADGTGKLKTGKIVTVFRQRFDDLPKILRKANKRNTMEWIDLCNKTVKDVSLCRGLPGIYILKDESSTNCKGLETIFPHWRIF